jgi:hypothetical protein
MKIKDLIKHLQTLDQDKELVIIGTDPTGWDYGMVVNENSIELEEVYPNEDNGLKGELEIPELNEDDDDFEGEVECYVIRIDC